MATNQTKRSLANSFSPSKRMRMSNEAELVESNPKMELEKKRQASRESSRRTRERERSRVDYFKANKLRLEGDNEKIRAENERLRKLIQLIKEGIAKKYSCAKGVVPPTSPVVQPTLSPKISPKLSAPTMTQQTQPQLQQMVIMALLASSLAANQPKPTPVVAPAPSTSVDQSQLLSILSSLTAMSRNNTSQVPNGSIPLFQGAQ
eukprot:Nitzschia sp. Nitz4//scaffold72_size95085//43133//43747//NITZ4_004758-RA/size95085-processed-gene-0.24-mRNA-1//-1//CDS//3329557369//5242//frame0